MKRALGFIFIVIACIAGFLSVRGTLPFIPIFGSSMEPELHSGNLLMIEPIVASEVEVGDIIIYNVPSIIRQYYNYPPVVAHRVIKVLTERGLAFRTAGDNTGEDPFTIMPRDLKGKVGDQIPYLGFPFLFLQSQQGLIFTVVALSLLAFFLYGGELGLVRRKAHRVVFSPVIQASYRTNRVLTQKIESTDQKMDATQQALEKFSAAIELYAQHLSSHTSAIQGLSGASQELKRSSAQQNNVLMTLMQTMGQPRPGVEEPISRVEQIIPEPEKAPQEPLKMTQEPEKAPPEPEKLTPEAEKAQSPPGCAISRKALLKRLREADLVKTPRY